MSLTIEELSELEDKIIEELPYKITAVLSKLREFIRISLTPTNFFNTLFIVIYLCILLFEQIIEYTTIDDFSISKK